MGIKKNVRRAFNFDLDTNKLKTVFSDYTIAYSKLKATLEKIGFEHRQGSGYVSEKHLSELSVFDIMETLSAANPWLKTCVKKFDVTEIGETHDLVGFLADKDNVETSNLNFLDPTLVAATKTTEEK